MDQDSGSNKISLAGLSAVPYTLLIPLAGRAAASRMFPEAGFSDPTAQEVLTRLTETGREFVHHKITVFSILERTRIFRDLTKEFIQRNPHTTVVNLGCGLSNYYQWLDYGTHSWIDADLAEVMQIRKQLIQPRNERHRFLEISITSSDWWEKLNLPKELPVQLIVEGVLMYLQPQEVIQFLKIFAEKASRGSEILFDFMCWIQIGRGRKHHPVLKYTKAEFAWGVRRLTDLAHIHPRLKLTSHHRILKNSSPVLSLSEAVFQKFTGVPFYAIAKLTVE